MIYANSLFQFRFRAFTNAPEFSFFTLCIPPVPWAVNANREDCANAQADMSHRFPNMP